ncbi:MAG: molybdenum cofactor biosynthesis protein MoaE, partial [Actinobacteria bacterium]|nr:molybdenum cofactor biosynthesis protein MoaE [Actinomycetota bacterium]
MIVELAAQPIDSSRLIASVSRPSNGGVCVFIGTVRDNADGRAVVKLEYEAFEPMALAKLYAIAQQAAERWGPLDLAISHRVGVLQVGEASVLIAAGAPHRGEAFAACRFII